MMLAKPQFEVIEIWDNTGDVEVWFGGDSTHSLREKIADELADKMPYVDKDCRDVYHVEMIVNSVLSNMMLSGNLHKGRTGRWSWVEKVKWNGKG